MMEELRSVALEPNTEIFKRIAGRRVVLAGLFSAKHPDPEAEMAALRDKIQANRGVVVGSILQRRGVSRSSRVGGAKAMERPLSAQTVLGSGKAKELAALCQAEQADTVIFWNPLTDNQWKHLTALTGVVVQSAASSGG